MDLTNQTKFKNIMIAALLIINIVCISALWMQISKRNDAPLPPPPAGNAGAVPLMQRELGLTPEQTKQMEKIHSDKVQALRNCNDSLDLLKKQFIEMIAQPGTDSAKVNQLIEQIGAMEAKTQILRLQLFNQLNSLCTPEQKQKLHPILTDLFVKKNAKPEAAKPKEPNVKRPTADEPPQMDQPRPDKPPTVDEKMQK